MALCAIGAESDSRADVAVPEPASEPQPRHRRHVTARSQVKPACGDSWQLDSDYLSAAFTDRP